jgi:uracil phosphoribosyltransferase
MNIIKMYNPLQALNPKNCNTEDSLPQTCQFDHSFIEETVKALKSNNVSERDMEKLCEALGMYLNDIITKDMKLLSQQYKDVNIVTHLNPKDFLL